MCVLGEKCKEKREKTTLKRCPKTPDFVPDFVPTEIWRGRGHFQLFIGKKLRGVQDQFPILLERYRCLVPKSVKFFKIRQLDQKL